MGFVARECQVHPSYLSRLELGDRTPPPPDDAFYDRVATALALTPQEAADLREAAATTQELRSGFEATEPETVAMVLALKRQLPTLQRSQVDAIRAILRMAGGAP